MLTLPPHTHGVKETAALTLLNFVFPSWPYKNACCGVCGKSTYNFFRVSCFSCWVREIWHFLASVEPWKYSDTLVNRFSSYPKKQNPNTNFWNTNPLFYFTESKRYTIPVLFIIVSNANKQIWRETSSILWNAFCIACNTLWLYIF